MEIPSLFMSGHGGSANRTFIVEDYPEEYGQWTIDEATVEQGKIDDERSCFQTWDDIEHGWQSSQFKSRQVKRRKGKGKGGFKRTGKAHFGEEQTQDPEWWSEEDSVWWSKGKRSKKVSSKGKNNLPENEFRTYHPEKVTGNEYLPYKERSKDQKRKGKEGAYPQSGLSASETPSEEGYPARKQIVLELSLCWLE